MSQSDADKIDAIEELLRVSNVDMHTSYGAPEIVRLWAELKAIMEPGRGKRGFYFLPSRTVKQVQR